MRRPREPGARLVHPLAPVRGLAERAVPHRAQRAARAARAARGQRAAAALARALPARRPDLGLPRARGAGRARSVPARVDRRCS